MRLPRLRTFLIYGAVGLFAAAAFLGLFVLYLARTLPPVVRLEGELVAESTKIFDRTGSVLLYEIHGEERRTVIPNNEIPEVVKRATLAIEDDGFYEHPAFDARAIVRAFAANVLRGRVAQGGSTITQQLAKNAFLTPERSLTRKLKELILAYRIERLYSKDEILGLYLNQIPYGKNSYGIEAASRTYFDKRARDLTLSEAAFLSALPKAPSYYSPWGSHRGELEERRKHILRRMRELGYIDEAELAYAIERPPQIGEEPRTSAFALAPHFIIAVQNYLVAKYGEEFASGGGLTVTTTLDVALQEIANRAVREGAERNTELYGGRNAALVAEDATTGEILALVGSKNYFGEAEPAGCVSGSTCAFEGNFDVALQGLRQPGSTFKPFVYLAAFMKGFTSETIVWDVPTEFSANNPSCPPAPDFSIENPLCYHPQNFDEVFRGPVLLKEALAQSINVPAVKTLYLAGLRETLDLARSLGISSLDDPDRFGLSLVLGGGEVKLSELVHAYTAFADDGRISPQTLISKIVDRRGKILEERSTASREVLDPLYVRALNDILSDHSLRAPLFRSSLSLTEVPGHQIALKTGTTDHYVDAWTIGYTPRLVVGVWSGNNNREPLQKRGSSILAAVPIWHAFMKEALKGEPFAAFPDPAPLPAAVPILRGELDRSKPHSILHELNRLDDSQYRNWEEAVQNWVRNNPSFRSPVFSPSATASADISPQNISISITSPRQGSFVVSGAVVEAIISSSTPIQSITAVLNGGVIDRVEGGAETSRNYSLKIDSAKLALQNKFALRVVSGALEREASVIFYKR